MTASPEKLETITVRSAATRAKLVAVAERLFAERGIEGVTLIEINRAAGQRNRNACRYHFGDKTRLLQAILDKHLPGIMQRRNELLDRCEAEGLSLHAVVRAFVRPVAEKLADPDGGRDFIRIHAQLLVTQTMTYDNPAASPLTLQDTHRLTHTLERALAHFQFPAAILQQRVLLAAMLLVHSLTDLSRMQEAMAIPGPVSDTAIFVSNLEDSIIALLSAPVSADTDQHLGQFNEPQRG